MVGFRPRDAVWNLAVLLAIAMAAGCSAYRGHRAETLRIRGSDTMLILAQAWAESYAKVDTHVAVEVSGGGSGQGIAALLKGAIDIANCSRNIKPCLLYTSDAADDLL